jgi:hypothetical protein
MQIRKPISFFRSVRERIFENETIRFLFFVERMPKHRVMESINVFFLASLSIICFLAGLGGFMLWDSYGLIGFMLYYVGTLVAVLELLHCLFDR